MKYKRILTGREVEAYTYDELIDIGKASFDFNGYQITYKDESFYVALTPTKTCIVKSQQMLVFNQGAVYGCDEFSFDRMYERVKQTN